MERRGDSVLLYFAVTGIGFHFILLFFFFDWFLMRLAEWVA